MGETFALLVIPDLENSVSLLSPHSQHPRSLTVHSGLGSQSWPLKYSSMKSAHTAVFMSHPRRKERTKHLGNRSLLLSLHLNLSPASSGEGYGVLLFVGLVSIKLYSRRLRYYDILSFFCKVGKVDECWNVQEIS